MAASSKDEPKDVPHKEEFQKYLEKAGVIDQLTKLLVNLYESPERPDNALEYIRTFLGSAMPAAADETAELKQRVEELEAQLREKDNEIASLREQLGQSEAPAADSNAPN